MSTTIHVGDCLDIMPTLDACSVDAIVTDPPYGLSFMGKDWDRGVPGEHFWREALRVAKPGAHLLAFGGTRMHHRLMVAIEDAGWELRDTLGWLFGSGFPKSRDVSKAIDREAGVERTEILYQRPGVTKGFDPGARDVIGLRAPATAPATAWHGWGTALKPAWEPIILARKPLVGTVAANVQQHGTGALNIDASRVGYAGTEDAAAAAAAAAEIRGKQVSRNTEGWGMQAQTLDRSEWLNGAAGLGRWPANILHDGSAEVVALFPSDAGAAAPPTGQADTIGSVYSGAPGARSTVYHGDIGSAARFFYVPKADERDRNDGLHHLSARQQDEGRKVGNPGGDNPRNRGVHARTNHHPTVKPTDLMRYLCRLITPPGGLILDPFAGSGSTGKAALLEGFRFVGIELSEEYAEIARARIYAAAPLFAGTA